ncbi:MAG: intein-containing adenosylcobalamin-dependent ribonucleoside-diphosphate reductase, partial [Elusimicrobia bacterium]|nr:intein-containing adenosylcobalamin-dependent ribonucleoside-diphosphate reductase [Elusimicrobiota bacterium]
MPVTRRWTRADRDPFEQIEWVRRSSSISDSSGGDVFRMDAVEVPRTWSQLSTDIAASKYLRKTGVPGAGAETSVRQLFDRVASTIREAGQGFGYFASKQDGAAFEAELKYMLVHQVGAFNSPVFFNVGLHHRYGITGTGGNWHWDPKLQAVVQGQNAYQNPQASACFIQSLDDHLPSIFELAKNEARIFKYGSGSGTNFSKIRSKHEKISGGGTASGLMFFLEVLDKGAGAIKSGGVASRAAKMVVLDMDHPEIVDFIQWKCREEKKAAVLIAAGYPSDFNGEAYHTVSGQNSNNSVRLSDAFMHAALSGGKWQTRERTSGKPVEELEARRLLNGVSQAAWACADPGVQFDDSINAWHTCPATDRIRASNPCVTGDTLVSTAKGLRRIEELVGQEAEIICGDGRRRWISQIFPTGNKPVYELKTRAGFRVKLTGDHRVYTANRGDVPACELTKDDLVVLGGVAFGEEVLPKEMAELVGLATGDGCLTSGYLHVRMDPNGEREILERAQQTINSAKKNKFGTVRETGTTVGVATCSPEIVGVAKRFAVLDKGSAGKRFTDAVFALSKEGQAAILRGLFSSDGTVANSGEKSQYVALDSTSLTLLRQVQLLLLGFGIKAKIYENRRVGPLVAMLPDGKGGSREYSVQQMHSLRISRTSRLLFQREIGFMDDSPKRAKLVELNAQVSSYRDHMVDRVESLTPCGEASVFDLTEPATQHFVANGLIVHNCSEYMFLDDSACNLASLNLMRFVRDDGGFDVEGFRHAARVFFIAQEILVELSSYPTQRIAQNSHDYRPLGLGYANLGTLLMVSGIPYDSAEGRAICGAITAMLTGRAYAVSAELARHKGPFNGFDKNREAMLAVMEKHRDAVDRIDAACPASLLSAARQDWDAAVEQGRRWGYRNAQATVLAPTGTIGLLMGCDTTGIEPEFALVKVKKLAGGGTLRIANESVGAALSRLGYSPVQIDAILQHVSREGTIEGAPGLKPEHLPVFDCANPSKAGGRYIEPMGHVRMMAAAQPFISGAISKTVNLPHETTVQEIERIYVESWRLGLKAISVYRDGCKLSQPLNVAAPAPKAEAAPASPRPLERKHLPQRRMGITQELKLGGQKFYLRTGEYEDGRLGEVWLDGGKPGSPLKGMLCAWATTLSLSLQYGVPLEELLDRLTFIKFDPSGPVQHPFVKNATSIIDLAARILSIEYLGRVDLAHVKPQAKPKARTRSVKAAPAVACAEPKNALDQHLSGMMGDAPLCDTCGHITVRNGTCYRCLNCG